MQESNRIISGSVGLKGKLKIEEINPETGEVVTEETYENLVVDVAGAETVAQYLAGQTPSDFVYMLIGSGNATAPAEGDTALETIEDTSPSLSASLNTTGGVSKIVVWSHTFSSGTGKSSIVEMAMATGTGTGVGILNRVTFPAKDNANNQLKLTYELTVS